MFTHAVKEIGPVIANAVAVFIYEHIHSLFSPVMAFYKSIKIMHPVINSVTIHIYKSPLKFSPAIVPISPYFALPFAIRKVIFFPGNIVAAILIHINDIPVSLPTFSVREFRTEVIDPVSIAINP